MNEASIRQLNQAILQLNTNVMLLMRLIEKMNKEGIKVTTQESHS